MPCKNLPILVIALALSLCMCRAARSLHSRQCSTTSTSREVLILLTRHGFSCANVVDMFSSWAGSKILHTNMRDPLLCGAGSSTTMEAGAQVEEWLKQHNLKIDEVLSSSLARAMQTAALQFPGHTVYPVPCISEVGFGKDNTAGSREYQVFEVAREVQEVFNGTYSVDYKWLNLFGHDGRSDWQSFREFLMMSYLPELEAKGVFKSKPDGEPIVIAVASHSNFMNTGEVRDKCSLLYPRRGSVRKVNNNQVVLLPYVYETLTPSEDCNDQTVRRQLKDHSSRECEAVAPGTSLYDDLGSGAKRQLCKRDLGMSCEAHIAKRASLTGLKDFVEEKLAKTEKKAIEKHAERSAAAELLKAANEAWQEETDDAKKSQLDRDMQRKASTATTLTEEFAKLHTELQSLMAETCMSGGNADWELSAEGEAAGLGKPLTIGGSGGLAVD